MTKLVLESTPELQALRDGNYHWVVTEMSSQATDQPLSVLEVKHPDTMDTVAVLELPFYRLPPSSNFAAYQFVTSFKPPFFSEIVPTSANLQVELKRWFRRPIYPKLTSENIHKVHLSYNCQIVTSQMYTGFLLAIWYDEQLQQRQWSIVYNSRREKQLKPRAVQSIVASDSEIDFIFFNADDRRFKQAMKFVEDWFGTRLYGWHKAQSKRQGRRH
ncbi:hypothetical protein H4R35_002504 [Dimargaris xerosporica]|nr:hypothetical protein H4R35_002504 [Dimargaris xerosporica]